MGATARILVPKGVKGLDSLEFGVWNLEFGGSKWVRCSQVTVLHDYQLLQKIGASVLTLYTTMKAGS